MPEKQKTQSTQSTQSTKYYKFDNLVAYAMFLRDHSYLVSESGGQVSSYAESWCYNCEHTILVVKNDKTFCFTSTGALDIPADAQIELVHPTVDELKNYMVEEVSIETGEVRQFKFSYIKTSWKSGFIYCTPKCVEFNERELFCDQYTYCLSPLAIVECGRSQYMSLSDYLVDRKLISTVDIVPDPDPALTEDEFRDKYPQFYGNNPKTRYISRYSFRGNLADIVQPASYDTVSGLVKFSFIEQGITLGAPNSSYSFDLFSSIIPARNFAMTPESFAKFCEATSKSNLIDKIADDYTENCVTFDDIKSGETYCISVLADTRDATDNRNAYGVSSQVGVIRTSDDEYMRVYKFDKAEVVFNCGNMIIIKQKSKRERSSAYINFFKSNIVCIEKCIKLSPLHHFNELDIDCGPCVDEHRRAELITDITRQYRDSNYNTSNFAMKEIIDAWSDNKAPLASVLRKSKYWDEDALSIIKNIQVESKPSGTYRVLINAMGLFEWFASRYPYVPTSEVSESDDTETIMSKLVLFVRHSLRSNYYKEDIAGNENDFVSCDLVDYSETGGYTLRSEDFVNNIKMYAKAIGKKINIATGMKFTRAINNICNAVLSDSRFDSYDRRRYEQDFAKLSDSSVYSKRDLIYVISINPIDYLRMSYGNSWFSCHYLDADDRDHCYQAGTQCYMTDAVSVVTYTLLPSDAEGNDTKDYRYIDKLNRQMVMITNGAFLQSRLYPDYNNYELNDTFLDVLYEELGGLLGVDKWTPVDTYDVFRSSPDSYHYPDYDYNDYNTRTFIKYGYEFIKSVEIGSQKICPSCGAYSSSEDSGITNTCYCYECGGEYYGWDDDDYYDEDRYYDDDEEYEDDDYDEE